MQREEIYFLKGLKGAVLVAEFSPDGHFLAAVGTCELSKAPAPVFRLCVSVSLAVSVCLCVCVCVCVCFRSLLMRRHGRACTGVGYGNWAVGNIRAALPRMLDT